MKIAIRNLFLLIALAISTSAVAVPIQGEIYFFGSASVTGTNLDGTAIDPYDLANATGISFNGVVVADALGDFATAGLSLFTPVTFNDFSWDPTLFIAGSLWSVGGFTFDLESVWVTEQSSSQLALSGSGVLRYNGGDETFATWTLSGDSAGSRFYFTSASSVPEPSSLALIGIGLLGLGFAKRRMS